MAEEQREQLLLSAYATADEKKLITDFIKEVAKVGRAGKTTLRLGDVITEIMLTAKEDNDFIQKVRHNLAGLEQN